MRILHIIPFLWSGAGNVLTRLCIAQAGENEVAIVTSGRSKGFTDWLDYRKRLKSAGVEHFQIDFFDREPGVFWRSVEAFAKLARTWQPDLIHCHSGVPACAAALSGSRFIGQIHSWGVGRPKWMNTMDLGGFRQAERVICGSVAYQRTLINGGIDPRRIRYLPWGIPLPLGEGGATTSGLTRRVKVTGSANTDTLTHPSGALSQTERDVFSIGFLGRIEPRKCQLELARAFHKFHRRHPESCLEFLGPVADKDYRDEICAFVSKSRLGESIKLRGRVTNPYPKVKVWNLFTSLSSDEGQGIAILEAMALGVPVLGRRVAGVEDYLRDRQTGIAVGSASSEEVAERMEWALHHKKDLALIASRARQMVESEYNWDSTVLKMNKLYETVTSTNPRLD